MTYAIFSTGGAQFRAEPGVTIKIPLLEAGMSELQMLDQMALLRGRLEPFSGRLATLLQRGRNSAALPALELNATPKSLEVQFPAKWLREHPLTSADLQQEFEYLRDTGFRLRVFSRGR